jgi:hypothetical protein
VNEVEPDKVPDLFGFPLLIIIPLLLHTHLSSPHAVSDIADQAARYHPLGIKYTGFISDQAQVGLGVKPSCFKFSSP